MKLVKSHLLCALLVNTLVLGAFASTEARASSCQDPLNEASPNKRSSTDEDYSDYNLRALTRCDGISIVYDLIHSTKKILNQIDDVEKMASENSDIAELLIINNKGKIGGFLRNSIVSRIGYENYSDKLLLGLMYWFGWENTDRTHQKPDRDKAVELFSIAVEGENSNAQNILGITYIYGWTKADGTYQKPDLEKAINLYTKYARSGNKNSHQYLNLLGDLLLNPMWYLYRFITVDLELEHNEDKAFKCYTTAAEFGNSDAQNSLGGMYKSSWIKADGTQQTPDLEKAINWYTKSARNGNTTATNMLNNLGVDFEYGWKNKYRCSQAPDEEKAFELYSIAVEFGHEGAHTFLGVMYESGWIKADGTIQKPDLEKAFELYSISANFGEPYAQNKLGGRYESGWIKADGTQQTPDLEKAIKWYKKSAKGSDESLDEVNLKHLGNKFQKGWKNEAGTQQTPDMDKAVECFAIVAQLGGAEAGEALWALLELEKEGEGTAFKSFELSTVNIDKM